MGDEALLGERLTDGRVWCEQLSNLGSRFVKEDIAKPKRENNGVTLLTRWASEQDGWVRTIVADVLAKRTQVSEAALTEIYGRFLIEKKLKDGQPIDAPVLEAPSIAGGSVRRSD